MFCIQLALVTILPTSVCVCCHTGSSDAMHAPITEVPSTVDAHDSHLGAAAFQDANDVPTIFGGDNA